MIPAMSTAHLAVAILLCLIPVFCIGTGIMFYVAFRLGLIHGGVQARAADSKMAVIGAKVGAKTDDNANGFSSIGDKNSSHFPTFGELVK